MYLTLIKQIFNINLFYYATLQFKIKVHNIVKLEKCYLI